MEFHSVKKISESVCKLQRTSRKPKLIILLNIHPLLEMCRPPFPDQLFLASLLETDELEELGNLFAFMALAPL